MKCSAAEKGCYQCCYGKYLKDFNHTIVVEIRVKILNSKQGTPERAFPTEQAHSLDCESLSSTKESWELVQLLLENIPQGK